LSKSREMMYLLLEKSSTFTLWGAAVHSLYVEDYCRAPRWMLTTRCHGHIIGDKSDEGQHTSLLVEMGNPKFKSF